MALQDDESSQFIGWSGDTFNPREVFGSDPDANSVHEEGPVQIAEKPRAFIWKEFISREEARHIVELAAPRMMRSMVGGGQAIDEVRTSYGMFIPRYQDAVIRGIEDRLAAWLQVPVDFQEAMQVLRYAPGQRYKPHMDANERMATLLIYLTDTPRGGETAFPDTNLHHYTDPALAPPEATLSECARGHVAVKPAVGTALLFYSMPPAAENPNASRAVDTYSMHTGCPPEEGLKWTATIWVHPEPFRPDNFTTSGPKPPLVDPAICGDFAPSCERWASAGECGKNPKYMVGGQGSPGQCRLACKVCTPCEPADHECHAKSRESQGFLPDLQGELQQLFAQNAAAGHL